MKILAIDPGPIKSAAVLWDGEKLLGTGILQNKWLAQKLADENFGWNDEPHIGLFAQTSVLAIEQIKCYGMTVADSVFDTVYWTGCFCEAFGRHYSVRIPRMAVKMHHCHDSRAKDGNIIQALKDRFGEPPSKKKENETYGGCHVAADIWQAWALAVHFWDTRCA